MAKGRQQYFADEVSIQKEAREFAIEEQLKAKIDSVEEGAQVNVIETVKVNGEALIPDEEKAVDVDVPVVEDNLYSVDTEAALSARQGKVLYDYIQNLQSRGRYLSNWNSATGLPTTNPSESPYLYRAGDYFLVSNVSTGTNYRPDGSQYEIGVASETVETDTVMVSDMYIYDGNVWQLIKNGERPIVIDDRMDIASTNPVENRVITQALRTKQDTILDLQTIREGAAAGATAVQPGDNLSTLSGDSDDIVEGSSHLFMTPQERTKLGNQTGVNTGDETQATIMAKLGAASATTNGYLTAADWNTFNDKQDAISDLQTIRENATAGAGAATTIAGYGDIVTHDVSEFATAAQGAKADTALQSGDNVSELVNDAGYITAAYHDSTKQDTLDLGTNLSWGLDGKLNATDTTYVAGDFDIKDLADSTGKRAEWDAKQDALDLGTNLSWGQDGKLNATDTTYTAGDGIEITQNNVIRNTRTSAEWGNITGTLSDQTDLQNALDTKQDELTAGDNITIENKCESDMKGPCPSGFHIPTVNEWNGLIDIMENALSLQYGHQWMQYLHMPYAGQRDCESGDVDRQRVEGFYATSIFDDATPSFSGAYFLLVRAGDTVYVEEYGLPVAMGFSVRGFKNEYEEPASSWTVVQGTLGNAGIFYDETNGLISITNGTTGYTIMDKNLGATTVYNSGDTLSEANCGKYYQWGNNYGFPRSGSITTSSTQVDASGYGPGNYYSSSTFITTSTSPFDWSSVENKNLRGGVSQGQQCALEISAQVPDSAQWGNITGTLSNQTDLQNALDGKVNLGNNKVYDNTVVEIGKWVHGESADVSGHHITLDPNGEVSTYNVTVAGHNEATLGSGNLTLLENTALGGDETTVISQDGITISEGQTTKTYNFLGNDRIATLSDVSGATSGAVSDASYDSTWDGVTTVAPSKNAVYDKLNADLNTKAFSLSGTTGATAFAEAQEIYDWFAAGGTPIVQFDGKTYILYSSNSAGIYLKGTDLNNRSSGGYKVIGTPSLAIRVSSGDVTEIESANLQIGGFLNTLENGQVFTPQYDSQPATKKYVDDSIAGVPTYTAGAGINIDANNEVSNTLPGPVIAASAPTGTEGALWYDTTNDVLMAHDGTAWKEAGTQMKVLSYGHSTWQDFLDAYNENAVVYCKASSNSNPGTGNQGRMAFMAFVSINGSTGLPTEVEFQYYRSRSDHNSAANQLDQVFVYKLTSAGTWTVTERNTAAKAVAGTGISLTYGSGNMTIANTGVTSFNGNTGAITLTPGTYLSLNNNVIDVDTSLIATKADLANFAGFLVVAQLPTTDIKTNIIYLLGPVGTGADKYEEYIYSNNNWILIGDTSIDLSPYFHKTNDDSDDIIEGSTNLFLTSAERTLLGNTSGINSGDETKTTIQTKLGAASTSNSGYLTSSDWDTFNGKADASDVNTKLFRLSSNLDLTTAQAAYDWWAAGKNPIITHGDGGMMRVLYSASTTRLEFVAEGYYSNGAVTPNGNISEKGLYMTYINANSSGVVTSVSAGEKDYIRYLNTNVDYPTPYVPQYDGSPATKKYVDDAVAGAGGYRPIFFAGSSLADIGAALANYLNTYSITPSNLSDVGPIGVWDDGPYYLQGTPTITADVQYRFTFQSPTTTTSTRNNSYSWTNHPLRRFAMDWDSTNSVWSYNSSDTSYVQVTSYNYLRTDVNYSTPYTPTYAGSPATKKYVDDTVAASVSSAITNETTGTTSSINKIWVGTEAEYQAITTYDEHTAYMTF